MIVTEFYNGQGLGNQLFAYIMTRVIAFDKGCKFGIAHPERFKGGSFLKLYFGKNVTGGIIPFEGGYPTQLPDQIQHYFCEERLNHPNRTDIRDYDWRVKDISDNTKIDGLFQGEDYFYHRKNEIREWLRIEPMKMPENLCIVNFRGGEYVGGNDLFLPLEYWKNAINYITSKVPNIQFKIVTDDVESAKKFFPNYEVSHDMANDYASIQHAKYLILSNSSFAILPAWLNENAKIIIAPKYWARHNVSDGYWSCGYNIVRGWLYIDKKGKISDYESCLKEKNEYMEKNKTLFYTGKPKINFRKKLLSSIKMLLPNKIKQKLKSILYK